MACISPAARARQRVHARVNTGALRKHCGHLRAAGQDAVAILKVAEHELFVANAEGFVQLQILAAASVLRHGGHAPIVQVAQAGAVRSLIASGRRRACTRIQQTCI